MIVIPKEQITPVNSLSYIDMLGVLAGLERLPGETSDQFADRIDLALVTDRGPDYIGVMNSLALSFGLEMRQAVKVSSEFDFNVQIQFPLLLASVGNEHTSVWLLRVSEDDFWEWKTISEVVAEFNTAALPITMEVVGEDGPAFQLVTQSNSKLVTGESLSGAKTQLLAHGKLVPDSERFSKPVPSYTVGADGRTLHFSAPPPDGTMISYRSRACPYSLIASPVTAFSLLDEGVRSAVQAGNGRIVYQAREYLQEILLRDGSYWGK